MTTLEQIEQLAKTLPEQWRVRIEIEQNSGCVVVIRPNGSDVSLDDGDSTIDEQLAYVMPFIRDEIDAEQLEARPFFDRRGWSEENVYAWRELPEPAPELAGEEK